MTVLGLGPMGAPIARTLLAAGMPVTVWNRTRTASEGFAGTGARIAGTPADAASDVILSVLPDIDQLEPLLDAATVSAWSAAGSRLVIVSTTSPGKVRSLASRLAAQGIAVSDAPVSGGVTGAEAGTLSVMVGADLADWDAIRPVLQLLGSRVARFGGPGQGTVAKLCNQVVVAGTLAAITEAMSLAEHAGLDPRELLATLQAGLADSALLRAKAEKLLTGDYSLGGSAVNQLKDLRYAGEVAGENGAPAPVTAVLTELFDALELRGRGGEDHAVLLELYRSGEAATVMPDGGRA